MKYKIYIDVDYGKPALVVDGQDLETFFDFVEDTVKSGAEISGVRVEPVKDQI